MNRFSHKLSFSQIEAKTAIAEHELAHQQNDVLLPSICVPGVPAILCWDNNNVLEETLSDEGTTQCKNGIVIQRKVHTCAKPKEEKPTHSFKKETF